MAERNVYANCPHEIVTIHDHVSPAGRLGLWSSQRTTIAIRVFGAVILIGFITMLVAQQVHITLLDQDLTTVQKTTKEQSETFQSNNVLLAQLKKVFQLKIDGLFALQGFNAYGYPSGSSLHWASENGKTGAVIVHLDGGADIEAKDKNGRAPLHLASMNGHLDVVNVLLDRKANMEVKDTSRFHLTPLHWASERGHVDVVKLLLDRGAQVDAEASDGKWTPLHYASAFGQVNVAKLLLDRGAKINKPNSSNWTPLHEASFTGNLNVVKLLLERKANINARTSDNKTSLGLAISTGCNGCAEVAAYLRQQGAKM